MLILVVESLKRLGIGGIEVDHNYETNLKDVFAVGDAIGS